MKSCKSLKGGLQEVAELLEVYLDFMFLVILFTTYCSPPSLAKPDLRILVFSYTIFVITYIISLCFFHHLSVFF